MSKFRLFVILCAIVGIYFLAFAPGDDASGAFAPVDQTLTPAKLATYLGVLEDVRCSGMTFGEALGLRNMTEDGWRLLDREVFLAISAFQEESELRDVAKIDRLIAEIEVQSIRADTESRERLEHELQTLQGLRASMGAQAGRSFLQEKDLQGARLIERWLPQINHAECWESPPPAEKPVHDPKPVDAAPSSPPVGRSVGMS